MRKLNIALMIVTILGALAECIGLGLENRKERILEERESDSEETEEEA